MSFTDNIKGYVRIKITGLGLERFINICHSKNIYLKELSASGICADCKVSLKDCKRLKEPRRISGVKIKIYDKKGLPFYLNKNRKRQFCVVGILLFFFVNLMLARYLWKIDIEGNTYYSDAVIIDFINTLDVEYGTKLSEISCDEIESALRENFNQIVWASADIKGSRLAISIKENQDTVFDELSADEYDITAAKAGVVHSIITRSGTPIVKAGDEVVEGDVLVMSKVESANESGEVFSTEYVHADADILIKTAYDYSDFIDRNYEKKEYTGRVMEVSGVKIGDKIFYMGLTKCSYELYDSYTDYSSVSPYENMVFPINYIFIYHKEYKLTETLYTDEELDIMAKDRLAKYMEELGENNVEIISENVSIEFDENGVKAAGKINVIESAVTLQKPVKEVLPEETETQS